LRRQDEFTLLVDLAAARAGAPIVSAFEGAPLAKVAALVARYEYSLCLFLFILLRCRLSLRRPRSHTAGLIIPPRIRTLLQRPSTALNAFLSTLITALHTFPTIASIAAASPFLLAALTDFLERRRNYEFAFDRAVAACFTWIGEGVLDERALVVAGFEARFAAAALRMPVRQIVEF
jgi:hypothetical protein